MDNDATSVVLDSPASGAEDRAPDTVPVGEDGNATPAPKADSDQIAIIEKRLKDTQAELTRKSQALSELEKERGTLQTEVLARLSKAIEDKGKADGLSANELAEQEAELLKELEEGGEKAVLKLMKRNNEALYSTVKRDLEARLEQEKSEREQMREQLATIRRQANPVYQANREKIEGLMKAGFSEDHALKALELLTPPIPEGDRAVAGTSTTRRGATETRGASEAEVAAYKKMMPDATKEEIDAFRKRGLRK